jgi:hypothetical protein
LGTNSAHPQCEVSLIVSWRKCCMRPEFEQTFQGTRKAWQRRSHPERWQMQRIRRASGFWSGSALSRASAPRCACRVSAAPAGTSSYAAPLLSRWQRMEAAGAAVRGPVQTESAAPSDETMVRNRLPRRLRVSCQRGISISISISISIRVPGYLPTPLPDCQK